MTLTAREAQIIASLSQGKILKEIAGEMGVGPSRVTQIMQRLRKRLGYRTTEQMLLSIQASENDIALAKEKAIHSPRT